MKKFNEHPNLFILGASKSGTTSLAKYIDQHPEIFVPEEKETYCLSGEEAYSKGRDWYIEKFFSVKKNYKYIVDATPAYMLFEKVAQRISSQVGAEARFIIIMREPVQRAYSMYCHLVRDGYETLSFEQALEEEVQRVGQLSWERDGHGLYSYYSGGLYAQQIKTYLKYFKKEQFLFLFYEELHDIDSICKKIFKFLKVDDEIIITNKSIFNKATSTRFEVIRKFLRSPTLIKIGQLLVPKGYRNRIRRKIQNINSKSIKNIPINDVTKKRLKDRYRPEILDLMKVLGVDLSNWLEE